MGSITLAAGKIPATRRVATAATGESVAVRWILIGVAVFFLALFIFLPLAIVFSQALAKGIGVGNSITPHAKAIIEAADKRNWENVRQELDRTQNSVQQAMNEVHDEKLSQLVSLGGWLRGTEVLTSVVTQHFSADGAELLHQPDLLSYFQTRLQAMPEFNLPIIHQIQGALGEVKPLIDVGDRRIPAESVKKVNEITTRLGHGIVMKD